MSARACAVNGSCRVLGILLCVSVAAATPVLAPLASAAEPVVSFETDAQRVRYERMLEEYRCLKCQNQNLAGSNAALAGDLRREIRSRIIAGADDAAIDEYLVARYGDFVRYRPRFGGLNLVLWIGPFVLLAIGLGVGWVMARRGRAAPSRTSEPGPDVDPGALSEARRLLER